MFSKIYVKAGRVIEPIKGRRVTGAEDSGLEGRYTVDIEGWQGGPRICLDMSEEDCCYTRFANDSLVDDEDNCRPMLRGGKPYLVALVDIFPGDELTYSYDHDYWIANGKSLSESARQLLRSKKVKLSKINLWSKWDTTFSVRGKTGGKEKKRKVNWVRNQAVLR